MKFGSPIVGGHMPYTGPSRQLRERPADERCTGCGRLSYVSGTGARVNPLTDGQCQTCISRAWPCRGCGKGHALDELSDESLCTRCWVAAMAKEAA